MKRFRNWRRRAAALALAPLTIAAISAAGPAGAAKNGPTAFDASRHQVGPNGKVTLEGHFRKPQPAAAPITGGTAASNESQPIRIQFKARGAEHWQDAHRSKTGRRGGFSTRVKVTRSGRFRAVSSDGRATKPEKVRVKSRTTARITEKHPRVGEKVGIRGRVAPSGTRRKVTVKVAGEKITTKTRADGTFRAKWKASKVGKRTIHVRTAGNKIAAGSADRAGKLTVFRPAEASWYGPGFYGGALACGGTLQPGTVGVANKTLPCGSKITVRYHHEQVKTKVIDRGPYVAGREFDLTEALKNKLGFGDTGTVLVSK